MNAIVTSKAEKANHYLKIKNDAFRKDITKPANSSNAFLARHCYCGKTYEEIIFQDDVSQAIRLANEDIDTVTVFLPKNS